MNINALLSPDESANDSRHVTSSRRASRAGDAGSAPVSASTSASSSQQQLQPLQASGLAQLSSTRAARKAAQRPARPSLHNTTRTASGLSHEIRRSPDLPGTAGSALLPPMGLDHQHQHTQQQQQQQQQQQHHHQNHQSQQRHHRQHLPPPQLTDQQSNPNAQPLHSHPLSRQPSQDLPPLSHSLLPPPPPPPSAHQQTLPLHSASPHVLEYVQTQSALHAQPTSAPTSHPTATTSIIRPPPPLAPGRNAPLPSAASLVASSPQSTASSISSNSSSALPPSTPLDHVTLGGVVQRPVATHRPVSTPQMDTLADLAAMQVAKPPRRPYSATHHRPSESHAHQPLSHPQPFSSVNVPPPGTLARTRPSMADLTMAEAPAQTPPPRDVTSHALSGSDSKTVTELLNILADHSYAYEQHIELINLLHKGFLSHVHAPADGTPPGDPATYPLLNDLRQAREAMDSRFAVGEDLWLDWLADEMLLARSSEARITVTELCQKATQDEPASVRLWLAYIDWVSACYAACQGVEGADLTGWTPEDCEMCRDLFTKDTVRTVFEQAVAATQWRLDESHLIWNRYARVLQEDLGSSPAPADVERLRLVFVQRFQIPHVHSEETMQVIWPFISHHEGNQYEAAMSQLEEISAMAKQTVAARNKLETRLSQALISGEREVIANAFDRYFKFEKLYNKQPGPFDHELRCALYERALLREPTHTEWWLDYVDYVTGTPAADQTSLLPMIERATRHCPWSGDLWARRILRSDVEQKSRDEIEATKHRATNSGLLEQGGMEEMIKMLQQWCSFLRRHAFSRPKSEDDLDTAEVGITMALEDVEQAGRKIYGEEFRGDPYFRLEQVQIKFYTESRRVDEARKIYRALAKRLGSSFDFWSKYYNWELWLWGYDRMTEKHRVETDTNGPDLATTVVQEALKEKEVDFPEKILEMYLYHFQQHESRSRLQLALIDAREYANALVRRRAKEAETAAQVPQPATAVDETMADVAEAEQPPEETTNGKRKRDGDAPHANGETRKRAKTESAMEIIPLEGQEPEPQTNGVASQVKRDREHNTITVKNLPVDVHEMDVKKFFRDCGETLSIEILADPSHDTASATVEFETHEDVLAAKTRHGKPLNGREIHISSGGQNTLYVTNYPPEYDEAAVRALFRSYGDIVSVRFPSLKYNSRRRFCYVTFLTAAMAQTASEALDGSRLDGLHTLVAKISDPDAKRQRSSPQAEGREVIIKNLDREASEAQVREFFAQHGAVESIKMLRLVNNKPTGTAFIVYASADEASSAVAHTDKAPFRNRILNVQMSSPKGGAPPLERARKEDIIIKKPLPSSQPDTSPNTPLSPAHTPSSTQPPPPDAHTARERKAALFNLPDTVSAARIQAVLEKSCGPILKLQLRRDILGAIVEFANVQDAFNARQGIDVSPLGDGVTTGDVGDLLALRKAKTSRKEGEDGEREGGADAAPSSSKSTAALIPPAQLARSSKPRPGGNLGSKRARLGVARPISTATPSASQDSAQPSTTPAVAAAPPVVKKSNADFRAMFNAANAAAATPKKDASAAPDSKLQPREDDGDDGAGRKEKKTKETETQEKAGKEKEKVNANGNGNGPAM